MQFNLGYIQFEGAPLLLGFTSSDCNSNLDDQKSTIGYVFTLGSKPITWACREKSAFALSLAEAEYHAVIHASNEPCIFNK